jgi:hypothetical protein
MVLNREQWNRFVEQGKQVYLALQNKDIPLDDSKYLYENKIRLNQLSHRLLNHLCISCGERKTEEGECQSCREAKRKPNNDG